MPPRRSTRDRKPLTAPSSPPSPQIATTRPRRAAAASGVVVSGEHSEDDDDDNENIEDEEFDEPRQTLRLTVKMPSGRLREATSSVTKNTAPVTSGRSTRNIKKSYVVETSSEEEEEEDEEEEEQEDYDELNDEVAEETAPNALQGDEDDEEEEEEGGAEADVDADGDIEMDEDADDGLPLGHQPIQSTHPPILRVNPPAAPKVKPKVTVTPAADTKLKSVEAKEMELEEDDDDDDEELSELGSDDDEEEDEEDDEDAEGDDVDDEEDMAEGDDSHSPDALSRGTTPDINKMTKRQRARLNEVHTASSFDSGAGGGGGGGGDFLELPMEPQIKKHLTAEEHAMRRAEMARRRKNLSEKRNEEEKQDTINRLLKKQAPKRRGKISAKEIEAQDRGDMSEAEEQVEEEVQIVPANPVFVRWVSNAQGCRVGVPVEWLGTPVGKVFGNGGASGKMVEEIEG